MSLPTELDLPLKENYENDKDYFRDVVFEIQRMYENMVDNVNGFIRNDTEIDQAQWIPTIASDGVPGTITYIHQVGWALRKGLLTDVWFDIEWNGKGGATGNLYVNLPYRVINSAGMPFVGALQDGYTPYGAYSSYNVNAIPNTYQGQIWGSGSNLPTAQASIENRGRMIGHVRYIGVADE